ncbi:MAG: alpha/beta hydrolase [Chloroflexi bacterium]|nr:alpha/beta hydrolase [Chloroflexota bacterium]
MDGWKVTSAGALEDLTAVADWLVERGHPRPHLLGWSWGGRLAERWCAAHPKRVDRLVLAAPALGSGRDEDAVPGEPYRENNMASVLAPWSPSSPSPPWQLLCCPGGPPGATFSQRPAR